MGNIMTSGQYTDLYSKDFSKIFVDEMGAKESIFDQWINVISIDDQYTKMSGVTGLPLMTQRSEGTEYPLSQIFQKYDKTFTPLTYKIKVRITREAYMDDHTGTLKIIPKFEAICARDTVEQSVSNLVDRCQNSNYTGPDGKVLCATDHPLKGEVGGTYSNRPTTNVDMTLSALEDSIISYKKIPNDQGIIRPRNPRYIKVAIDNTFNLGKILDSKYTLTTSLIENQIQKYKLIPLEDPYQIDTDLWSIMGDKSENQIFWVWRERPNTQMDTDSTTDDILLKCYFRGVDGWVDARGIYASIGA